MRRVREVLRLRIAGIGLNEIARRVGVAPSTVRLTKPAAGYRPLAYFPRKLSKRDIRHPQPIRH